MSYEAEGIFTLLYRLNTVEAIHCITLLLLLVRFTITFVDLNSNLLRMSVERQRKAGGRFVQSARSAYLSQK